MNFGLLAYATTNLGDEVQSIAARRFLPRVDVLLQRDALPREPDGSGPVHAILNGWYAQQPVMWPPHPRIRPLLLSMHFNGRRVRKRFWWARPANGSSRKARSARATAPRSRCCSARASRPGMAAA